MFSCFSAHNIMLPDFVHFLVCDDDVIVCALENSHVQAFNPDTFQLIYVRIYKLII